MSPRRSLRRTALLLLASTLLTLALAEGAFRLVHHFQPVFFLPRTDHNQFRARPGSQHIGYPVNALGFYDREVQIEKPEGVYRILALGDSFAFGVVPYPDNYLTLLEDHLDLGRGRVEVVNMGIPRTGPLEYLSLLEHEGLRLAPDHVLLSFYIGNDFNPPGPKAKAGPEPPRLFLGAFLRYLFVIRPQAADNLYVTEGEFRDDVPTLQPQSHLKILRRRLSLYNLRDPRRDERLQHVTSTLAKIRDLCRDRDIPLTVLIIPDEIQIDFELRKELFAAYPRLDPSRFSFRVPNSRLHRRLEYLEVPYLELLPVLEAAHREEPVFKPRDTHWNRAGNRVAARAAAGYLKQHYPLP